jgi:hypothetical protein
VTAVTMPRAEVALRPAVARAARTIAGTTAAGLLLGFVVGGIGSRLAMRALFLTSADTVRGVTSDDGFAIGQFSVPATLNLLLVGTVIGVIGAFVYLAVRPFLIGPRWLQIVTCAAGGGAVIGSMLVHTRGVDFTVLSPRWFAIALFVALPAIFAALAPVVVDRATRPDGWFHTAPAKVALLPLLVFLVPPIFVFILIPAVLVVAVRHWRDRSPALAGFSRHPVTLWVVRAGWLGVAVYGLVGLVRDAVILL